MADKELEQLRQQRLAQMESQFVRLNFKKHSRWLSTIYSLCTNGTFLFIYLNLLQGGKDAEQQKAMQDRARQQEDAKNSILSQIMDQDARARCKYKLQELL